MKAYYSFVLSTALLLPLAFASASASASPECSVTFNGEDKTGEFFVVDPDSGEKYVDCVGSSKCRDAVIEHCPVIRCGENESCNSAQILEFTDYVTCEGTHACHRANMTASDLGNGPIVRCSGGGACDVAVIKGRSLDEVTCTGPKSCRKAHIEGPRIVRCHEGHESARACEGSSTFETRCLYCGKNGCEEYINMCKYKIITGDYEATSDGDGIHNVFETESYQTCEPETLMGDCPDGSESQLHLELTGLEEIQAVQDTIDDEEMSVIEQIKTAEGINAEEVMEEINGMDEEP